MQYDDMIIEASETERVPTPDKQWLGQFKVRVLSSPAGEMKPEEAVSVGYNDKQLQASLRKLDRRELDRAGLIEIGRTLALLLLPPDKPEGATASVRDLLATSLIQVGPDRGIRLRLRLPPMLAALPWEYVYVDRAGGGDGVDGFLALDPRVAIVRHEVLPAPDPPLLITGDIKVVVALASAARLPELDLAKEKTDLEHALGEQAGIKPVFLENATLDQVQGAIPGAGIFHFAGHGVFTRQQSDLPGTYSGIGMLAMNDQCVDAEQLGINLQGNGVRLAVLGGCETGRRDGINVWSGIAPALVKAEIPAVVANQFSIKDKCAIAFSRQFYQALAGGLSIERAVSAGRIAAYNADREGRDWGVSVLYLRAADGCLFEGTADSNARQRAKTSAEAQVNVRVKEVAAGGEVLGAQVKEMLAGKLAVSVVIGGTVYGRVVGATIERLDGGNVTVNETADTVGKGGVLIGAKINRKG